MTLCVASFGVTIDKFTERLQRATDGFVQIVLAHKDPKTLHTFPKIRIENYGNMPKIGIEPQNRHRKSGKSAQNRHRMLITDY